MLDEDSKLFRESIKGTKPIVQDTYLLTPPRRHVKQRIIKQDLHKTENNLFYFSDEYEPLLEEDKVRYLRSGENPHLLKQLRRGDFSPMLFLDLHGLTKEQAKLELSSLILTCEKERIDCVSIMTGYGTYTLKQQIPRWLVQHPKVRALHQAPKEWGGGAAILVLICIEEIGCM